MISPTSNAHTGIGNGHLRFNRSCGGAGPGRPTNLPVCSLKPTPEQGTPRSLKSAFGWRVGHSQSSSQKGDGFLTVVLRLGRCYSIKPCKHLFLAWSKNDVPALVEFNHADDHVSALGSTIDRHETSLAL